MAYECRILADSISPAGHRLTTFLAVAPRFILAEQNTHRELSRSSASSRAIPVDDRIAAIQKDPFVPEAFGRNQGGMIPGAPLEGEAAARAFLNWNAAKLAAIKFAGALKDDEVHKSYANRLLEPFAWHPAIVSSTNWENFRHLRVHPAAQGEFSKIAKIMMDLRDASTPRLVTPDQWHLPLVEELDEGGDLVRTGRTPDFWRPWAKVSAARCGRISFERHDRRDFGKDVARADDFMVKGHMSPLEHPARPMAPWELDAYEQYEALFWVEGEGKRTMRVTEDFLDAVRDRSPDVERIRLVGEPKRVHYCGNYNGWVQLRKLVPNEADALAPQT